MQGSVSDMLVLLLSCAPPSIACLKKSQENLMVMVSPQQMGFSTAVSGNGSGLGLLHTGVSHPCSIDTTRATCPEGLPTVMARSSLAFGMSVLHVPPGGNYLQQLIHPSKPAPWHKYSGTWSNVVLNEARFGFTESGFFPVILRH